MIQSEVREEIEAQIRRQLKTQMASRLSHMADQMQGLNARQLERAAQLKAQERQWKQASR